MRKRLPGAAMALLFALALVAYLVADQVLVASFLATLAVVVWGFSPSPLGAVPSRRPAVGPAELKQYRREHPGATIGDAIEHAGR